MEAKLKQGTIITATTKDGYFWEINDTFIFTDTPEIYNEGKKLFFPKNHELSGCGFPEDMFETC